jgi:hypothetical protein
MKIAQQDGTLHNGDQMDDKDKKQKAKHVVHLKAPEDKDKYGPSHEMRMACTRPREQWLNALPQTV